MTEKLAPKLRFKEFSGPMKKMCFGDVFSFRSTNSFSRDNLNYENGSVYNIHYGDIHTKFQINFKLENEFVPFVNEEISISRIPDDNYCKEGDLIIADASEDYADIGKNIEIVSLNGRKVLAGLHTFLARPDRFKMFIGYSGYSMLSSTVRKQIMTIAQGTKVLSLSTSRLSKVELFIPTLPEQQKIATFLTTVDEKINLLKTQKSELERYKKGVMQKIFSQELRFKDEQGKEFPKWEESKINKLVCIYDGTHQTPNYVESGIPFYSVEHITANQFEETKFISREVFDQENKRVKLETGDILMTRIGSVGKAKLIDWDVEASFYVSLAMFKKSDKISNKYLAHFVHSVFFQRELWKRTIHVAFPKKINLGDLGDCLVKYPSIEEQTKIANFLSALDEKIALNGEQITKMEVWKKGLLQQMFV